MPDPIINRVPREALSEDHKRVYDLGMQRAGESVLTEVLGNHPELLEWYLDDFYAGIFYNKTAGMSVDVRTKELLRLKLSKQHGCYYCNRVNQVDALEAGITQAQIDALLNPSPDLFDEKDLAVIELGAQMMLQNMTGQLTEDLYERLRKYYSDKQIIEMGYIAAVLTGMAKFLFTFDMVTREETCPITPAA